MLKSVIGTILKNRQLMFAAIAVTALIGTVAPFAHVAYATSLAQETVRGVFDDEGFGDLFATDDDDDNGDGDGVTQGDDSQNLEQAQEQEQEIEQDQDAEQDAEQDVDQRSDQSETNIQANELSTGDNTATVTQANAAEQEVEAESEAEASASASDGKDRKDKKKDRHYSGSSDSPDAQAIADSVATATGIIDQDNRADVDQDSSIHDVDLSNNVQFGDDTNTQTAIPIIDQDVDQDQRAANLQQQEQRAANLDLEEFDFSYGDYVVTTGGVDGNGNGDGNGDDDCEGLLGLPLAICLALEARVG